MNMFYVFKKLNIRSRSLGEVIIGHIVLVNNAHSIATEVY